MFKLHEINLRVMVLRLNFLQTMWRCI